MGTEIFGSIARVYSMALLASQQYAQVPASINEIFRNGSLAPLPRVCVCVAYLLRPVIVIINHWSGKSSLCLGRLIASDPSK